MQIKIMTFNVRGSFNDDGDNVWEKRRALNLATIKKYAPDILGFQEAQTGNLETYDAELNDYACEHCFPAPRDNGFEHVPLYWREDRFEKLDSGGFYLSETPDVPSIGWEAMLIRPTTWLKLREKTSGTAFMVLNTHFPHQMDKHETRQECAKLIVRQIETLAPDLAAIILGDFNALPDSLAYQTFLENGFIDTYRAAGHAEDVNTFHRFKGEKFEAEAIRIDWIFTQDAAQKFTIERCDVIRDAEPPLYPSDHYPVMATVMLK